MPGTLAKPLVISLEVFHEHLVSDKAFNIFKHLALSQTFRESCSKEGFVAILYYAASRFQLKIKHALYLFLINNYEKHINLPLSM